MILRTTFRSCGAGVLIDAWIDALRVTTLLVIRTVIVTATLDYITLHQRIATEAAQTAAFSPIRSAEAFCSNAAWVMVETRVDAISVDTCLACFAFRINAATNRTTSDVGIALVTILTRAHRPVILDRTDGIRATAAWVAALSVNACLLCRTFGISRANTYWCL